MADELVLDLNVVAVGQVVLPDVFQGVNLCIILQLIVVLALATFAVVGIPRHIHIVPCAFPSAFAREVSPASGVETALVLPVQADHHYTVGVLG